MKDLTQWATDEIDRAYWYDHRRPLSVAVDRLLKSTPSVYSRSEYGARLDALKAAEGRLKEPVFFFDSWGSLWETCSPGVHAVAFGPTGTARVAASQDADLEQHDDETQWSAAERAGRIVRGDEWDVLSK